MRKFLLGAALAMVCTMGMTAMASETTVTGTYKPGVNSLDASITDSAQTIIIYKGTETASITGENIYYVDQATNDAGFIGNVNMLMKAGASEGTYTVAVDGGKSTTFEISKGDVAVEGCVPAKALEVGAAYEDSADYCSVAFQIEDIQYADLLDFNTIKSRVGDWVVATSISEVIGDWKSKFETFPNIDATVNGLIQVDWVPVQQAEKFELYFTTDVVDAPQA